MEASPAAPLRHIRSLPGADALSSLAAQFLPARFTFIFAYKNLRLTIPTLLAWFSCVMFHYACTL